MGKINSAYRPSVSPSQPPSPLKVRALTPRWDAVPTRHAPLEVLVLLVVEPMLVLLRGFVVSVLDGFDPPLKLLELAIAFARMFSTCCFFATSESLSPKPRRCNLSSIAVVLWSRGLRPLRAGILWAIVRMTDCTWSLGLAGPCMAAQGQRCSCPWGGETERDAAAALGLQTVLVDGASQQQCATAE